MIRAASACEPTTVASQSTSAWVSQIKARIANTAAAMTMTRPMASARMLSDISVRKSVNSFRARSTDSRRASPRSFGTFSGMRASAYIRFRGNRKRVTGWLDTYLIVRIANLQTSLLPRSTPLGAERSCGQPRQHGNWNGSGRVFDYPRNQAVIYLPMRGSIILYRARTALLLRALARLGTLRGPTLHQDKQS